jgi:hypothetical protein
MPAPTIAMVGLCWLIALAKQVYHSSFQTRIYERESYGELADEQYLEIREGGLLPGWHAVGLDGLV